MTAPLDRNGDAMWSWRQYRARRLALGYSQQELAELIACHPGEIEKIESGQYRKANWARTLRASLNRWLVYLEGQSSGRTPRI